MLDFPARARIRKHENNPKNYLKRIIELNNKILKLIYNHSTFNIKGKKGC